MDRKTAAAGRVLHIIPYTHADYAWTHTRQWHIERAALILNEVLELMDRYPDVTYCVDSINHLLEPFLQAYPEKKEALARRIREGRIEITGGIISLLRPTQIGGETFIRNLQLGRRQLEALLGPVPVHVYMNVDVSIGHRQIPQLMKLANIKYYRGWRPQGAMDYNQVPRAFWFEGLDGSRILTTRGSYVGFCGVQYLNDAATNYPAAADMFYQKELQDILSKNGTKNVWVSHGMDDTRLLRDYDDTPVDIYGFVQKWNENENCCLRFSTPTKYFEAVEKEQLPVVADALDTCDVAYNAPCKGQNGLWRKRQMLERLLCATESLCALASRFGFAYPGAELDALWEDAAFLSAHAMEFLLKEDFAECVYIAQRVHAQAIALARAAKAYIARRLDVDQKAVVLLNTDAKTRTEQVCLDLAFPEGAQAFEILDLQGNSCPYQIQHTIQGDISYAGSTMDCARVLVEASVPAMGYTCLYVQNKAPLHAGVTFNLTENAVDWGLKGASCEVIDNGVYSITFCRGEIIRIQQGDRTLYEKSDDASALCALSFVHVKEHTANSWLYFNHITAIDAFAVQSWAFEEFGPRRWVLCCKGTLGPVKAVRKTIVDINSARIDFEVELLVSEPAHGYFKASFPTGEMPDFTGAIPFGTEEKNIEQIHYGKATANPTDNIERMWEGVFLSKDFVHYTGRGGLRQSVLANTVGGYYIYDKYDHTVANILSRSLHTSSAENWERHTDQLVLGRHHFKLSFLSLANTMETVREHKKICTPLHTDVKFSFTGTETLPPSYSLCEIKTENVVLSAFARCGEHYLLRAYEAAGKDTEFVAVFGAAVRSARMIDFFGNTVANDICIHGNTVTMPLGHNGIVNLEIALA